MEEIRHEAPVYREPGTPARLFVYAFALVAPLMTIFAGLLPAALLARFGTEAGGIAITSVLSVAYLSGLVLAVRRVRVLAARFTPPLPLPGDIWNIGVAPPPRRSRNWPIRFRRPRRPNGGLTATAPGVDRVAA